MNLSERVQRVILDTETDKIRCAESILGLGVVAGLLMDGQVAAAQIIILQLTKILISTKALEDLYRAVKAHT